MLRGRKLAAPCRAGSLDQAVQPTCSTPGGMAACTPHPWVIMQQEHRSVKPLLPRRVCPRFLAGLLRTGLKSRCWASRKPSTACLRRCEKSRRFSPPKILDRPLPRGPLQNLTSGKHVVECQLPEGDIRGRSVAVNMSACQAEDRGFESRRSRLLTSPHTVLVGSSADTRRCEKTRWP